MTNRRFTAEIRKIWEDACAKAEELVREQGVKVFQSKWDLHRYVKHKRTDVIVRRGSELLALFVNGRADGNRPFVIATPEAIRKERKETRKDAIKQLRRSIETSKDCLFRDQAKLMELLSDKKDEEIDYDD